MNTHSALDSPRSKIHRALDARLRPSYLRFLSVTVLVVVGVSICAMFATSKRGRTVFGPTLGADFAGFFVAAQILEHGDTTKLYDRDLHFRLYHELLPNLAANDAIPYVHPPFVAEALRPLTRVPYEFAVAIWLAISALLYGSAVWMLTRSLTGIPREYRSLILMLALTFAPFIFECWLGGQLSAVGFFSFALAWLALNRERPVAAGMALGLCFYKPTLLLLVVPMLVVGRRWKILAGMTITGISLVAVSVASVGWDTSVGYLDVLVQFRAAVATAGGGLRTWKYIDLYTMARSLFGTGFPVALVAFVCLSALPVAWLARAWWRWPSMEARQRQWLWAATLAWSPVVNVYVGVYDSILVVQSALLAADLLFREHRSETPLLTSGLAYVALAIAASAWVSQYIARVSGVQVYTLALAGLGVFLLRRVQGTGAGKVGGRVE